jgi:hypothetical protein
MTFFTVLRISKHPLTLASIDDGANTSCWLLMLVEMFYGNLSFNNSYIS